MVTVRRELEAAQGDASANKEAVLQQISERQAAFENSIQAAAGNDVADVQEEKKEGNFNEDNGGANGFVNMLSLFLQEAESQQSILQTTAFDAQSMVAETIKWLGENPDQVEPLPVFETVKAFALEFDQAFARVHRLIVSAAAVGSKKIS